MVSKDVHTGIPATCENATWRDKRDYADVIPLKIPRWGDDPGLLGHVGPLSSRGPWEIEEGGRKDGSSRRTQPSIAGAGCLEPKMQAAFRGGKSKEVDSALEPPGEIQPY